MKFRTRYQDVSWMGLVLLVFGLVYASSLTMVYVDGDDAQSMAYHALGRNLAVQPPFADYQGGADLLLRFMPANEALLRTVSMTLTAGTMAGCALLMLALAFDLLGDVAVRMKPMVALVVLLSIPEVFYLGLVYHPSAVGMCLILTSHLMLRRAIRLSEANDGWGRGAWVRASLAAALLGAGGGIRWSLVLYGWIIFWDCVIGPSRRPAQSKREYLSRAVFAASWGLAAAGAWLVAVWASGYGLREVYAFERFAIDWMTYHYDWRVVLAQIVSAFSPALFVLCLWGWIFLLRSHKKLAVLAAIAAIPLVPLISWADPKQYFWFFPILVMSASAGWLTFVAWAKRSSGARVLQIAMAVLVLLPWVVGVRATSGDTAWGPAFELRAYDREPAPEVRPSLVVGAGAAVPTPEGPRPLWGHGVVLLGGEWRRFNRSVAAERTLMVQTAIREGLPILVLQGANGYMVCELVRQGFTDVGIVATSADGALVSMQRFTNRDGHSVLLMKLRPRPSRFVGDASSIQEVIERAGSNSVVATGYPENFRMLFKAAPDAMHKIGAGSAVLSLKRLTAAINR